jgi:hypothetical protein
LITAPCAAAKYHVIETRNPVFIPNTLFGRSEDLSSPRFRGLREKYGLDEIVKGENDEFQRILLLRHWLYKRVIVDKSKPAVLGDPLEMLAAAPEGGAYHCAHMTPMQNTILNAMGHVTRYVFAGAGQKEGRLSGAHASNEVWVNELQKWVLMDAELDAHFEMKGVPLSALEIRRELLDNNAARVFRVDGPDRIQQPREPDDSYGRTPRTYTFISWYPEADMHTRYPQKRSLKEIVFADDYWREHTWYRGGSRHFAYDTGLFVPVADATAIYWTPNVLDVDVSINGDSANIVIHSETPNLKEYQIRKPDGDWSPTPDAFQLPLQGPRVERQLRSVNTAGIAGPVYKLVLEQ